MQVLLGEILSLLKLSKRDGCRVTVNETSLHSFNQEEKEKAVLFFLATETLSQLSPLLKLG
jgi:hypothetical protein